MSLLSHDVLGFDLDPMAFINPFTTVSEIVRISKEEEEKPKIAAALEASTTADQKAIAAIAQAMSAPESLANAQAAQTTIDAANAAGAGIGVTPDKRLIPIKEILARAEENQKAATNPHIAQMRGNLVEAARIVAVAVGSKQPIPQFVPPATNNAQAPAQTPPPVLDRVTLLRQRAAAATAEYEKLKAYQNRNKTKVNGENTMSGYTILGEGHSVGEGGSWMDMLPGLFSAAGGAAGSLIEKKKTDDALVSSETSALASASLALWSAVTAA